MIIRDTRTSTFRSCARWLAFASGVALAACAKDAEPNDTAANASVTTTGEQPTTGASTSSGVTTVPPSGAPTDTAASGPDTAGSVVGVPSSGVVNTTQSSAATSGPPPDASSVETSGSQSSSGTGSAPVDSTDPSTTEEPAASTAMGSGGTPDVGGAAGAPGAGGEGTTPVPPVAGACPELGAVGEGADWVNGEMLEFNDNGGWCWYQDERVIVDQENGKLIIASVASSGSREANVEVTHWDLATGTSERFHIGTMGYTDDHDVAALVKRPEGGYAAMWAGHNDDCNSYFSTFDGSAWSSSASFAWPECPTPSGKKITYSNMWYMGDTLYSYVRSIDTSPHYLYSDDGGKSWDLAGRLTSTPQVGYVAGYYKYWGNHTDRIDFFGTEAHPRDNDNSLFHGYVQDGKIHKSTGEVVDEDFSDREAKEVGQYTQVFKTGTTINGVKLEHMWNADLVRYDDGTVAAIGTGRVSGTGSDDPDKRLLYFRFDGTEWKTTYLAKAGTKLYSSEQDYTGLGALDPDNPHIIYISTAFDPRTDEGEFAGKKEIWKGVTCDDGATFDWEPVTANSKMDNVRPVVPKWDSGHTALLWLRGTYTSAQAYSFKVVGLLSEQ